jgi:hypothetical protein
MVFSQISDFAPWGIVPAASVFSRLFIGCSSRTVFIKTVPLGSLEEWQKKARNFAVGRYPKALILRNLAKN